MKHWIFTRSILQTMTTNLDRNLMTLKAAKNYFIAYGVEIKGNTKERFLKNLAIEVNKE